MDRVADGDTNRRREAESSERSSSTTRDPHGPLLPAPVGRATYLSQIVVGQVLMVRPRREAVRHDLFGKCEAWKPRIKGM